AYLVPYLVLLIIIGIPLFFLELAVGQRIRRGSIGVWHYVCPRLGGIGFSSCIVSRGLVAGTSQEAEGLLLGTGFTDQSPGQGLCVGRRVGMELPVASVTPMDPRLQVCLFVGLYYNVIIGWSIFYFFKSFQYPLPWMVEPECEKSSATTYFWYREALDISNSISESGGLNWKMTLCLLVAWSIVGMAVVKGIQSSGKVMYFSSLFPYVVLACFLVRGLLLRGAVDGILHMFTPKVTLLLGSRNQVPQCHLVSAGPSVLRSKGGVRSCHAPARARAQQLLADSKSIFMLLSQMLWNTLLPA
ncbi:Sodium-dependent neutral amino acid transporter SLC6A17, partial [Eschrichtius robustus]|nr:Sodium-dependent neutral amino acid transporter SLC6A17 [Eschrichtius robustus]